MFFNIFEFVRLFALFGVFFFLHLVMNEILELPLEKLPIIFESVDGEVHKGTYVSDEQMFFIGFKDKGDFKFLWEVESWEYIHQ